MLDRKPFAKENDYQYMMYMYNERSNELVGKRENQQIIYIFNERSSNGFVIFDTIFDFFQERTKKNVT